MRTKQIKSYALTKESIEKIENIAAELCMSNSSAVNLIIRHGYRTISKLIKNKENESCMNVSIVDAKQ